MPPKPLAEGDVEGLGRLITQSHISLRDDFEVSSRALNDMVDAALASPGCLGARMTGAGFAGCAIALVEEGDVGSFIHETESRYRVVSDEEPVIFQCTASDGAGVLPVS